MAVRPVISQLKANATSVGLINSVLKNAGGYLAGAPLANNTIESIRQIGSYINAYQQRQNQFLSALVNRIGLVIISSKSYKNPWEWAKRGNLEYGESVEEIYVNLAKVESFIDGSLGTNSVLSDLFGQRKPDVRAAFHQMNFQKKYPVSVSEDQLKNAFTSFDGLVQLVDYIVQSLYTAFEYDEYAMYKLLLGTLALEGKITAVSVGAVNSEATAKAAITAVKTVSDNIVFLKDMYNMAGVMTHTPKEDQFVIRSTRINSFIDVNVLASAFNMDKVEFTGHQILMDGYDTTWQKRIAELMADDPSFVPFTDEQIALLNGIDFFLIDREFIMQFDKLVKMNDEYIPNTLTWNYFLHHWAIFSASPFKNCILFNEATNTVTSISITPDDVTAAAGTQVSFTATIEGDGIFNPDVTWSVTGAASASTQIVDGTLYIGADETETSLTVTATSASDSTKTATAAVTVTAAATMSLKKSAAK